MNGVEQQKVDRIRDPIGFFTTVLQDDPWETQIAIARALEKPRARVAVKGCHASSKTYGAAEFVLWFITRYRDGIVVTTAPTDRQVAIEVTGKDGDALIPITLARQIIDLVESGDGE